METPTSVHKECADIEGAPKVCGAEHPRITISCEVNAYPHAGSHVGRVLVQKRVGPSEVRIVYWWG
jgi:hypothetical protein